MVLTLGCRHTMSNEHSRVSGAGATPANRTAADELPICGVLGPGICCSSCMYVCQRGLLRHCNGLCCVFLQYGVLEKAGNLLVTATTAEPGNAAMICSSCNFTLTEGIISRSGCCCEWCAVLSSNQVQAPLQPRHFRVQNTWSIAWQKPTARCC